MISAIALTQSCGSGSRLSFARMVSAGFVQTEGLRVCVLSSDVGTDGLLEVGEGLEDAASDGPSGEGGEEVLDGVEP